MNPCAYSSICESTKDNLEVAIEALREIYTYVDNNKHNHKLFQKIMDFN